MTNSTKNYVSPFVEVISEEQAKQEAEFLKKAFKLGMINEMLLQYQNSDGSYLENGGFAGKLTNKSLDYYLEFLVAKPCFIPLRYSVARDANFEKD